ncbi:MAG: hypothetical protein QXT98_07365 [Archaeoglobaceae archaeon]
MRAHPYPQAIRGTTEEILNALRNSYEKSRREPEIVKDFVTRVSKIPPRGPIRVKTHFIHQKPMISFVKKFPNGRSRCELGDILFINKQINAHGNLVLYKSSLSQVKKSQDTNDFHLTIPRHQLEFYSKPDFFPFRFGKETRLLRPSSRWYAHFLSISHAEDLCFSFYVPSHSWTKPHVIGRCFGNFLTLFVSGQVGENLLRNRIFRDLITDIYRFCGASPDPPEEFEEDREEGGFGIIEFTTKIEGKRYEQSILF